MIPVTNNSILGQRVQSNGKFPGRGIPHHRYTIHRGHSTSNDIVDEPNECTGSHNSVEGQLQIQDLITPQLP
jgi:hypothetical protein